MAFGFDSSLPLSGPKLPEPTLNESLQAGMQLADLLRKHKQETALADIYRANANTPEGLSSALMRGGFGPQAFAAQDQTSQLELQGAQRAKALRDVQDAHRKHVGELFYGVKDQAGWDAARQELASSPDPMIAVYAGKIPAQFDAGAAERLGNLALPAEKRAMLEGKRPGSVLAYGENGETFFVDPHKPDQTAAPVMTPEGTQLRKSIRKPGAGGAGGGGGAADQLSPEAIDAMAQKFNVTAELPPARGFGKGTMAKILNRALELKPGADIASAGAEYKATSASLKKLQITADAVDAFEATAGKNLDTFLELSRKLADTGSPLFNAPYRKFKEGVEGNPDMAAINAARATAVAEIGKVLSGGTGGGALTEGARHEVESLIKPDATLEQIAAAGNVLKRDMANRKTAVQAQLDEMRGRISGKRKPAESEGTSAAKLNPGEILMLDTKGRPHAVAETDVKDAENHGWKRR